MRREYAAEESKLGTAFIEKMLDIAQSREKNRVKEINYNKAVTGFLQDDERRSNPVAAYYELKVLKSGSEHLRKAWINLCGHLSYDKYLKKLRLNQTGCQVEDLPDNSWLLHVDFTLASPYVSANAQYFDLIDNNLRREKVFQVPYIDSSQWKGMLRHSLLHSLAEDTAHDKESFARRRLRATLLFGSEPHEYDCYFKEVYQEATDVYRNIAKQKIGKNSDDSLRDNQGNLYFFPTYFFEQVGFEIVNPHDRGTGAGKDPFYLETVPAGGKGRFSLLYVPLHLLNTESEKLQEAKDSLELVLQGLDDIFQYHGLGAKTSGGFGSVHVGQELSGSLQWHLPSAGAAGAKEKTEAVDAIPPEYLLFYDEKQVVKPIFFDEQGEFLSNQTIKPVIQEMGGSLNLYRKFRRWYKDDGKNNNQLAGETGKANTPGLFEFTGRKELLELPKRISTEVEGRL